MTNDQILAKFTDAGLISGGWRTNKKLVAVVRACMEKAVAAEREACARVCSDGSWVTATVPEAIWGQRTAGNLCANAIRARSSDPQQEQE